MTKYKHLKLSDYKLIKEGALRLPRIRTEKGPGLSDWEIRLEGLRAIRRIDFGMTCGWLVSVSGRVSLGQGRAQRMSRRMTARLRHSAHFHDRVELVERVADVLLRHFLGNLEHEHRKRLLRPTRDGNLRNVHSIRIRTRLPCQTISLHF